MTDASPAICDTYAAQDPRVRSIHQRNAGVSAARNVGLATATGEFVTFIDADDWCSPMLIERLMAELAAHPDAGMALSSFARVPGSAYAAPLAPCSRGSSAASESIKHFAGPHHTLFAVLWAKVFRRDVLKGVEFPEGRLHEDEFTTYRLLLRAPSVLVPEPLYLYRQRSTGITHTALTTERLLDALDAADQQVVAFRTVGEHGAAAWQRVRPCENACCSSACCAPRAKARKRSVRLTYFVRPRARRCPPMYRSLCACWAASHEEAPRRQHGPS